MRKRKAELARSDSSTDAKLKALRWRIEQWRQTRKKRGAMPEELWAEATSLATTQGVYPVSKALNIKYDGLKKRVRLAQPEGQPQPTEPLETGFVQLNAAQFFGTSAPSGGEIEMVSASGDRMVLRLPAGQNMEPGVLSDSFWRAHR